MTFTENTISPTDAGLEDLRFRDFVENAAVGMFQTTEDGHYLAANQALAALFGYDSPKELMESVTDIPRQLYVDPARREEFLRNLREHRNVSDFEARVYRRDQSVISISTSARMVRDPSGRVSFEGTVNDVTARRQAEAALRASEQKWLSLMQNSGDRLIIIRRDGTILFLNRPTPKSGTTMVGSCIYDYMPVESRETLGAIIGEVFDTEEIRVFELNELTAEGFSGWYATRAVPIPGEGKVGSVMLVCTDITHRKKAEDELGASKRFIERVADTSPDFLYVYDLMERRYVYANHQLFNILGLTPEQLAEMGQIFPEQFTHPDDIALLAERLRLLSTATEDDVFECEYRIRHTDGQWLWLNSRDTIFTRTSDGRPRQILGTARDITERKRTRDALRESEERFRVLVEKTNVVPWEAELETGRFTYVGPQAEELLGYPIQDWSSEGFWFEHVHPADREWASGFRTESAARLRDFELEYRMLSAAGETLWIKDIVHPQVGAGRVSRIGGFMVNITNRRRVEEQLEKSHEQLRALAARGQMAREEERIRIAREIHDELGQSLTALKMDLHWLDVRAARGEASASGFFHDKIVAMTESIDSTIGTVRRIATELRPPVLDQLGLPEAVEWHAQEFQKRFGIPCTVDLDWEISVTNQNLSTAVFRIFQEILTNIARHAHATAVSVEMRIDPDHLTLEVRDNGKGISDDDLSESLGLLGMRERALIFNGQVTFQGAPEKGTTVTVKIPSISLNAEP